MESPVNKRYSTQAFGGLQMHWISHTFYRLRLNGCDRPKAIWNDGLFRQLKKKVKTSSVWLSLERQSQPQAISARVVNELPSLTVVKIIETISLLRKLFCQLILLWFDCWRKILSSFSTIFKHCAKLRTPHDGTTYWWLAVGTMSKKSLIQQAVLQSAIRVSSFVINSALVQSISLHRFVFLSTRERQIGRAYRVYAVFFSKFQMGICAEREIGTLKENRILSNTILR